MSQQKESLIIVGARGMGRELAGYLMTEGYSVKGFLDGGFSETKWTYPIPILDSPENWMPSHDERFIVALGEAKWRQHYVKLLTERAGLPHGPFRRLHLSSHKVKWCHKV